MTVAVLSAGVAAGGAQAARGRGVAATVATVGAIAAGVAVPEAALIPGVVIGGGAVLAFRYLPGLRRRPAPSAHAAPAPARFGLKQAVAKTITFRIIVTSLDFTTNYTSRL